MDGIIELDPSLQGLSAAGPDQILTLCCDSSSDSFKVAAAALASLILLAASVDALCSRISDVVAGTVDSAFWCEERLSGGVEV